MGCTNCKERLALHFVTVENTPVFSFDDRCFQSKVLDVYDGDTITLALPVDSKYYQFRCRISGVDCAEIRTKDQEEKKLGLQAKDFLRNMILGKVVTAEFDRHHDARGRLLAKIIFNGQDVADIMIKAGYGYSYHGEKKKELADWSQN